MTISTTTIIRDEQNNPIPQYYNPATQVFEATEGANGSPNVQTTGAPLSAVSVLQNAATAAGVGTSMSVAGYATALLAVSGTFVATITFQAIGPDGNTYPVNAKNVLTGIVSSTTTGTGLYEVEVRGLSSVVANITAYTSGSVTVKGQAQAVAASGQQVSLAGSNVLLGEYSFAYASAAAANTVVNEPVPLPTQYQASALYLVTISNPSSLGSALTVTFQNGISINGTLTQATVTTLTIASGVTQSYLVQGILLGDGAGQISTSNSVATAAAGTAYVQVRRP